MAEADFVLASRGNVLHTSLLRGYTLAGSQFVTPGAPTPLLLHTLLFIPLSMATHFTSIRVWAARAVVLNVLTAGLPTISRQKAPLHPHWMFHGTAVPAT